MKLGIFALLVLVGVDAGMETTGEGRPDNLKNQDQIQDEILKAMKDSGVLNEMQDKLGDMLFQENEIENTGKPKNFLTSQEEKMIKSFVDEYTNENNIKLDSELIVNVVRRVQKTPSPNLPLIFVQLSPLIDVVAAVASKSSNIATIIERQAPVFDSPAKTKDILHTLTENLKSELVRLNIDSAKKEKKVPPPPKKQQKKKEKKPELDIGDYLKLGSTLLKGGNAGQILSVLSGDADMSTMMALLPQLIQDGNYKDILTKMVFGYLDSSPYGPVVKNVINNFMESEQGKSAMSTGFHYFEVFSKSESGRRLVSLMPKIVAANDLDAFLEIVHEEAEWNWSQVFSNIENSDYKEKSLEQVSEFIVTSYEYVKNPPKNSMMAKVPIFINGFLISKGIPAFDSKRPTESIIKIINKGIKLFTTQKLDVTPFVKSFSDAIQKSISKQSKGLPFDELSTTQKKYLLSRLLDTEIVEPMQAVWSVYTHSVNNLDCVQHLLCQVNFKERQNGVESRITVTKASSLAAGWALAQVKQKSGLQYWNMYKQAVWSGASGEDCMSLYKVDKSTCNIFPWQQKDFMSTSYDHIEL